MAPRHPISAFIIHGRIEPLSLVLIGEVASPDTLLVGFS